MVFSAMASLADAMQMLRRGGDAPPSPPGAQGMLLGTNSPAPTHCPQRGALAKSAQHPVDQEKACYRVDTHHHMHLGLKGFSTDSIAITRRPEQASASKALRRTKAASSGLLSHPGNNSFSMRHQSLHTREDKSTGDKQPCITALRPVRPAAPLPALNLQVSR